MELSKAQREVLGVLGNDEKQVLEALKDIYSKALTDIDDKIAAIVGRTTPENLQSVIYQKQYQEMLKQQVSSQLDALNAAQYSTINDYLQRSYNTGYIGTMYDIAAQGIPIMVPIDQENVIRAVTLDSKLSKGLYDSLGEDVNALKKTVAKEVTRGFAKGAGYDTIARAIEKAMVGGQQNGGNLYRAQRIARTEAHRIYNTAAHDAQKVAHSKGADVVKQWIAVIDSRTRDSHKELDGELVEGEDDTFSNGLLYPGDPDGPAEEVINCRCFLGQRARWALDDDELQRLKGDAAAAGIDNAENFPDFEQKYLANDNNEVYNNIQLNRKERNTGDYAKLTVPMQKKVVDRICKKYGVDTAGLTIKIQRDTKAIGTGYFGVADDVKIGRIDLLPDAFRSELDVAKTVYHESVHVEQLKKYGREYTQNNIEKMEEEAYRREGDYFKHYESNNVAK